MNPKNLLTEGVDYEYFPNWPGTSYHGFVYDRSTHVFFAKCGMSHSLANTVYCAYISGFIVCYISDDKYNRFDNYSNHYDTRASTLRIQGLSKESFQKPWKDKKCLNWELIGFYSGRLLGLSELPPIINDFWKKQNFGGPLFCIPCTKSEWREVTKNESEFCEKVRIEDHAKKFKSRLDYFKSIPLLYGEEKGKCIQFLQKCGFTVCKTKVLLPAVKRSARRKMRKVKPEEQSFFAMILGAKKLVDIRQ